MFEKACGIQNDGCPLKYIYIYFSKLSVKQDFHKDISYVSSETSKLSEYMQMFFLDSIFDILAYLGAPEIVVP